jgi:hypothetical protein
VRSGDAACSDPARIDVRDVEAAIAHPDVQAALAMTTPPIYGNRGVADGPNFNFMRADGAASTPASTATRPRRPARRSRRRERAGQLLRGSDQQQRMDPSCARSRTEARSA